MSDFTAFVESFSPHNVGKTHQLSCGTTASNLFHHPLFISSYEPLCVTQIRMFRGSSTLIFSVYYAQMCVFVCVLYIYNLNALQNDLYTLVCFMLSLISREPIQQTLLNKKTETELRKTETTETTLPMGVVLVSEQQVYNLINNTKKMRLQIWAGSVENSCR